MIEENKNTEYTTFMATPTELSVLLRLYTSKLNSPTIQLADFCDYLQKYARHYLEEVPELIKYFDNTQAVVSKEMEKLEIDSKIFISVDAKGQKQVFVPYFYIDKMIQRYREIDEKSEVPFPLASEIPSEFPSAIMKPIYITTDFTTLIENGERTNAFLFQLIFPDETPPIVFPASISSEKLLDLSMSKVRLFLRKDESRDYIQKRLMIANPGKEMTIKNHLVQFLTRPSEAIRALKHSGDTFLFWSYLCSYIRQDYTKKSEKTPEEFALLQAVFITEYLNNYYKSKAQQDLQRETALKNLESCFQKYPYYFDMETISRFSDTRGVPLLGQYNNTDLEAFIKEKTSESGFDSLPALLVFKTMTNNRYFVLKDKIIPLVVRLCNENRKIIKDIITHEWYQLLSTYRQSEAMKNQQEFEKKIESVCKTSAPILYAILNATFISLLSFEANTQDKDAPNGFKMFDHGRLLPYSDLLMLNRQELLTDTRILLPFWFTIPILSAILSFFRRPRQPKKKIIKTAAAENGKQITDTDPSLLPQQRKAELKNAVAAIEKRLVPAGSTLESTLTAQLELWNRTLDPQVKENLTEDVNSLIRDYIRRIIKTIKATTFNIARVENLSNTLVDTPSLMKIKNRDALLAYVRLYILQLIRNIN
jgi:hypothetical protein